MLLNAVNNNITQTNPIETSTIVTDFVKQTFGKNSIYATTSSGHAEKQNGYMQTEKEWNIKAARFAKNTHNRIRAIMDSLKIQPNPEKPMIPLSIGDPTTFGNLRAADETMLAVQKSLETGKYNGYAHSQGHESARKAVAKYSAHQSPGKDINIDDIMICSGCSSALEYCILALVDAGQNILLPRPGFCLYHTHAVAMDIEVRYYDLLPERQWQADLEQLESLIDEKTAAILINNPSNPCGTVFSKSHLLDIINICERHCLPIIADEIYEHFVFPGSKYYSVSSLSQNVPVLTCGGITKRFLVPGWRTGWIVIHDRENRLAEVKRGIKNLCNRIVGSNTIVQGALPYILENTPQSFFDDVIQSIYANAKLAFRALKVIRGLKPIMPNGAMYMMVGVDIEHFPKFKDDMAFVEDLVNEQSVFCLPGSCFDMPNFVRLVLTVPGNMIEEACARIAEFCEHHYKVDPNVIENGLLQP